MPKHRQTHSAPPVDDPAPDAPPTLEAEWLGLVGAGRAALESEVAFQSARAGLALKLAGRAALWGALVLALLFFVLMALVVGALLGLSAWLGPWAATLVVVLALLAATVLGGLAAMRAIRAIKRLFGDEGAA